MTPTEPRLDMVVRIRVHAEFAGDEPGLLARNIHEQVEAAVDLATHRWGVDREAVTVELVPPPVLQLPLLSAEEAAQLRERTLHQIERVCEVPSTVLHTEPCESTAQEMAELKQRWVKAYGRPLFDPRGMVQAREPWWRRWFRRD